MSTSNEVALQKNGSNVMELVGNEEAFFDLVDHKFQELDPDCDDKISVKELHPAVADIGAALGFPTHGVSSSSSSHIYSEVLNQERVSKREFKEVVLDILVGMAVGLQRDPVVILRIDGEDLRDFLSCPNFSSQTILLFSDIEYHGSLHHFIVKAFEKLTVNRGMPPCSDSWVMSNIVEPALQCCDLKSGDLPNSEERLVETFRKALEIVAARLKEHPVIVAHYQNTFNGSGVKRLLSNKFDLDRCLDKATEAIPRERNGKISKEFLHVALDSLASSAGLPPYGVVNQVDVVMEEALAKWNGNDGKPVEVDEFKRLMTEIMGSVMRSLEGNPIQVSSNSVVHEPLASSSLILPPPAL